MYRPMDMPLINNGQKVRFMFDGWPSIVFGGVAQPQLRNFRWKVAAAIDNFISPNGKYRILVGPDKDDDQWPKALRVGGGAVGFTERCSTWYELWRQVNGFPPDLYTDIQNVSTLEKEK